MDMVGKTMGSYRVLRKLGEGGMGVVYLAEHPLIGRKAAVKMLLPEYSTNAAVVQRFFNEARATSRLNHPGIVEVFDFGHHESGAAFIIMEFLEGESLAARLSREGRLSTNLVLEIGRQVASAVGTAHAHGIIHRDLKPDNIFLLPVPESPSGIRTKILDFGIAKLTGPDGSGKQTTAHLVIGTPAYMSPEQCQGAGFVDVRSDVYSIGCILFEMAVGRPPFMAANPMAIILAQVSAPVPPLEEQGVDAALAAVIRRALAKDPAERFQTMGELMGALAAVADGRKPSGPYAVPPSQAVSSVAAAPLQAGTIGGAAGEMVSGAQGAGSRRLRLAVGAGLLVVAVGGGAWWALPHGTPVVSPPRHEEPAAARVHLQVGSEPAGAEVYRAADGVRIGRTPHVVEMAATTGELVFMLRLDGYEDERAALPADRDGTVTLRLIPRPRSPELPAVDPPGVTPAPHVANPRAKTAERKKSTPRETSEPPSTGNVPGTGTNGMPILGN